MRPSEKLMLREYAKFWHSPAKPGQHVTVTVAALRVHSLIAVLLTSLAWALWDYVPDHVAEAAPQRKSTHIAIPAPLFDIAETVCAKNGGYKSVTVERKSDVFTFNCADGLALRDTLVRVK